MTLLKTVIGPRGENGRAAMQRLLTRDTRYQERLGAKERRRARCDELMSVVARCVSDGKLTEARRTSWTP